MNDVKHWYLSKTVWGGAVAVLAACGHLIGLDIPDAEQAAIVDAVTAIAAAAGGLLAIYGRLTAGKRLE